MTNEEAMKILKGAIKKPNTKDGYLGQALGMAIRALEQQPCEDCISREEVIKLLEKEDWADTVTGVLVLPLVQPQRKWIPCSERLPNEFVDVLCNTDSEEIFIATYLGKMNDGTDCFDDNNGMMCEGNIIAWMPLPEPYKAESEE